MLHMNKKRIDLIVFNLQSSNTRGDRIITNYTRKRDRVHFLPKFTLSIKLN